MGGIHNHDDYLVYTILHKTKQCICTYCFLQFHAEIGGGGGGLKKYLGGP